MLAGRSMAARGIAAGLAVLIMAAAAQAVRVKDLGRVYGPMETPLVGYGLVVGLPGTGDDAKFGPAIKMLANTLTNLGANNLPLEVRGARNVAVVMVSATLPPSNRAGDRLNVEVATVGNAKSIAGGRLVLCPLGVPVPGYEEIAIASGDVMISDLFPTKGTIDNGAIVQQAVPNELTPDRKVTFKLLPQNADFSVATRIVEAIHQDMNFDTAGGQAPVARAIDDATIEITLTEKQAENPVPFISRIERLSVPGLDYDMEARVVIDEKAGMFWAINGNVEISPVSVGFAGIQITIKSGQGGQASTTLDQLIDTLRLPPIQATPREVIGILKALETAGALHAKVVRQ